MDLFISPLLVFCLMIFVRPSCQEPHFDRSYELSLVNHVNETGHCMVNFALVHASRGSRRSWRANIKHEVVVDGEIETHSVTGSLIAPPPKPKDYELFPGIGFYKFHADPGSFHDGKLICAQEGGHLLIVNSQAEANVVKTLYERHPKAWKWANIGFQDKNEDGNYTTLFGKSLESAGYNNWHPGEPDHSYGLAYCGVIDKQGLLGAGVCSATRPFICEYDLSWGA